MDPRLGSALAGDRARPMAATLIHATRIAVTRRGVSPSVFDVVALVGKERTLARLGKLQASLA